MSPKRGDEARQIEPDAQEPTYIAAMAEPARPRVTLKHDDTFALIDVHGDIGASPGGTDGLYCRDTRHLSRLELAVNGATPLLLGSTLRDDSLYLHADLTNPDIYTDGQLALPKDVLHIDRIVYLRDDALHQRLVISNHGERAAWLELSLHIDCDFADLFEVRGMCRARRGRMRRSAGPGDRVALAYVGLDEVERNTVAAFEPAPDRYTATAAVFAIALEPHECHRIFVTVGTRPPVDPPPMPFFQGIMRAGRQNARDKRTAATISTLNAGANAVLERARADLAMLTTETTDGAYPYAGVPWYSTTFGRDGLITAMQMLDLEPGIARGVLKRLARFQARSTRAESDAEPGKILHEMRSGEMAALFEVPFGLYYGSIDATPLFVLLAGLYLQRSGDIAFIRELWPAVEAALRWIDTVGDRDGDGFVEYERAAETGLVNQGWKDSHDSVFHADGRLARGPIALVEVQSYVHAAKLAAAACAEVLGRSTHAMELRAEAEALAWRFESAFWCEELCTYALGLDGDKRQLRVRASNAGHALFTGIAEGSRAGRVVEQLLGPAFFSGWGIRTVAIGEARYNPMSYHNGSVWPHDTALAVAGMARYGHAAAAGPILRGLLDAAACMEHGRLPELFCGFRRRRGRRPTLYPVACSPQAWACGALYQIVTAMLGIEIDAAARLVRLRRPHVPDYLGAVTVRRLGVGGGSIDFAVRNDPAGTASLEILRTSGDVKVALA
jgi:glycogen debranching enzyme